MSVERAAEMGFRREKAETTLAIIDAMHAPPETFDVAMDLARYVRIPLGEATWAIVMGRHSLRRLGLIVPPGADPLAYVREQVRGQAEAYTHTMYGMLAVREAQGHTFSRVFTDVLERMFGPR